MNPKDRAYQLFNSFLKYTWNGEDNLDYNNAKNCAIISIELFKSSFTENDVKEYWIDVIKELENI